MPNNDGYETKRYTPGVGAFVEIVGSRAKDAGYERFEGLWELVSLDIR